MDHKEKSENKESHKLSVKDQQINFLFSNTVWNRVLLQ